MSVVSSYRTRIRLSVSRTVGGELDPTWRLMQEAVEAVAEEYGGRVTDHVFDYFGNRTRCDFAVVTDAFPRGVGIRVDPRGEVSFVYDNYDERGRGYRRAAAEIAERVVQSYTALAVAKALAEMNYAVSVEEGREEPGGIRAVVVRGEL